MRFYLYMLVHICFRACEYLEAVSISENEDIQDIQVMVPSPAQDLLPN